MSISITRRDKGVHVLSPFMLSYTCQYSLFQTIVTGIGNSHLLLYLVTLMQLMINVMEDTRTARSEDAILGSSSVSAVVLPSAILRFSPVCIGLAILPPKNIHNMF